MRTPRPLVLSIDVGSSSVRSGLFDVEGDSIEGTAARRPHRFTLSAGGRAEADAEALLDLVIQCIDETLQRQAARAGITAVAFCTFLHGLVGTDTEGRALTPVITWADSRSSDLAGRFFYTGAESCPQFLRPNLWDRAADENASTFSHGVSG